MLRRQFLGRVGGLMIAMTAAVGRGAPAAQSSSERVGLGTVIFRNRFAQTKPKSIATIANPLTLLEVPKYYRDRFGTRNLEFWSNHFESLDPSYLAELRDRVQ